MYVSLYLSDSVGSDITGQLSGDIYTTEIGQPYKPVPLV